VVVVIASDTTRPRADVEALCACLEAFRRQRDAPEIELVVPCHDAVDGLDELAARFPEAVIVKVSGPKGPSLTGERVHHHSLRTAGLRAARGELLALAEDHARPDPHWCAGMLAAHREGAGDFAGVGGAIDNAVDRPLAWAVYLCDFARYQSPVPEGESELASDINVAYRREALEAVRPVWEEGFYEVIVNRALRERGGKLVLRNDARMWQHREGLRPWPAVLERFAWARSYAAVRSGSLGGRRLLYALLAPLLPPLLIARIGRLCRERGRFGKFLGALPWLVPLTAAWSLGEAAGYAAPRSAASESRSP
jgi:hypothetical protein